MTVPALLPILTTLCDKIGIPRDRTFLFGDKTVDGCRPFYDLGKDKNHVGYPIQGVQPDDVAFICFSSGTTGLAKGVMLTHRNFIAQMMQVTRFDENANISTDILLGFLPFYHIFGLTSLVLGSFYRATPIVIMAKYSLEPFCQLVEKYRVTNVSIVPPVGK